MTIRQALRRRAVQDYRRARARTELERTGAKMAWTGAEWFFFYPNGSFGLAANRAEAERKLRDWKP
jgi:hypothetical protein